MTIISVCVCVCVLLVHLFLYDHADVNNLPVLPSI